MFVEFVLLREVGNGGTTVEYNVGDIVKLSTDCDARAGKVLEIEGAMVTVGWANDSKTTFSALVLGRLSHKLSTETAGFRQDDSDTRRIPSSTLDKMLRRRSASGTSASAA